MKTLRPLCTAFALALASAVPALAAGGRQDNSNYLVWAFLSLCGLIVVVQLLPVIFMAFGIVAGVFRGKDREIKAVNE